MYPSLRIWTKRDHTRGNGPFERGEG
jgi:osmotically-inducible protein OsmY